MAETGVIWHSSSADAVAARLGTDPRSGLSAGEAEKRRGRIGPNEPAPAKHEPWWEEALEILREPLILVLVAVAIVYALLGEVEDAATIAVVILAVAAVEVANEQRAKGAIASLRTLSAPTTTAVRGGESIEIGARELVPGDVVLLLPGRRVPADLRLVEAVALRIDESNLTGESVPVAKDAGQVLAAETALGDRVNLAWAGTLVTAGKGRGVVVATGPATELGRIARLAGEVREPRTPLQLQMRELSRWLLAVALGFSVLVPVLGVFVARRPLQEMVLSGLTLAFATIPEELPLLITIVLGLGSYQLARRHAIVRRLRAAETLGSVSVVGTDKTGTLTENRLRVGELFAGGATMRPPLDQRLPALMRLLEIGVLANDAQVQRADGRSAFVGDPTEVALLEAAQAAGLDVAQRRSAVHVLEERPFDDVRKRQSVVYERGGRRYLALKGAPESVLAICSRISEDGSDRDLGGDARERITQTVGEMAGRGLRVLAFAEREVPGAAVGAQERDLSFVGLAGLEDPPRLEVAAAIAELHAAGVRVLMLTGDHPLTARAIALRVGIDAERVVSGPELERASEADLRTLVSSASVFARITPEHKLRVVQALAAEGAVVAVTGDGVNDAPALRQAAVGIAMGRTGTDIAREAADLVLADDNFATVTAAIGAGRALYDNLRKAVRYYLAAKVALIAASLAAVLAQLPLPFAPVQIILLELFMDLGASTTFVSEPPESEVMRTAPRDPRRPFMDRAMQLGIAGGGLSLAAAVVVAYFWAWGQGLGAAAAQTAAFVTWLVGHVVLAAHMRTQEPLRWASLRANRAFLIWAAAAIVLVVLGTNLPVLQSRLQLTTLPPAAWIISILLGLLLPSWWQIAKWADVGALRLSSATAHRKRAASAAHESEAT